MELLNMKQCSRPVDGNCVVYCNRQANFYLDCGDAVLMRVQTNDGKYHFLWQSAAKRLDIIPRFYPAFQEDAFEPITHMKAIRPIELNEVFCHNGDGYYLAENDVGTKSIRLLSVYASQQVVEQIAAYDNLTAPVEQICLQKIYQWGESGQFASVAWAVFRANVCDHIPVFEGDNDAFKELINGLHFAKTMRIGDSFIWQKKMYVLQTDANGKLCLAQSAVRKDESMWQMVLPGLQKSAKLSKPAQILSLGRD